LRTSRIAYIFLVTMLVLLHGIHLKKDAQAIMDKWIVNIWNVIEN